MKTFSFFFILISSIVFSQNSEEQLIKAAVNNLFDGMKTSDSAKITKAFSKNAVLQTITKNGEVKNENLKDFAISISKSRKRKPGRKNYIFKYFN